MRPEDRRHALEVLVASLRGQPPKGDPIYEQMLKGVNLERPFSEHGRPFPVVKQLGAEEALWLLGCLYDPYPQPDRRWADKLDKQWATKSDWQWFRQQGVVALVTPFLKSENHRERIDAAVLLGRAGFGKETAAVLAAEVARPYDFPEITSIGKGMPDLRFRDKAYMVYALAHHARDVNDLKKFADPKAMYRDIRYGLARGLAQRRNADALPLIVDMATRDPITLIRQQASYAIADIQDAYRLRGEKVLDCKLPAERPLEALYPPRGLKWADTQFQEFDAKLPPLPKDTPALTKYLDQQLVPANIRNLNMAQATGTKFMMTGRVEETRLAFAALAKQPDADARAKLLAALDTPYPYAHHLAAAALAQRKDQAAVPTLLAKLPVYLKAQDTVGYWAACEALTEMRAKEAVPLLAQHATAANPPGTYGPVGMPVGYIAARSLACIVADAKHKEVARCLASDNIWLRAGALRGLAEARAPGVEALLDEAAGEEQPALVRQEARAQLALLKKQ
jgi:HEAT repeat protein